MFISPQTKSRLKSALAKAGKPQVQALRRVQAQAQEQLTNYLEQEYDLIPVYYAVLAESIVSEAVKSIVKSIPPDAPGVLLPDKEWLEGLLIDCKKLLIEWNESGKAEEILDEWERRQEKIKHGI